VFSRDIVRVCRRGATVVASMMLVVGVAAPAAADEVSRIRSRPDSDGPTRVSVGLFLTDLASIETAEETVNIAGYLFLRWKDRRLAYDPVAIGTDRRVYTLDQVWWPGLEFVTAPRDRTRVSYEYRVSPDGSVFYQERFFSTVATRLNLRWFPYDRQTVTVAAESFIHDSREVVFTADTKISGVGKEAPPSEWIIGPASVRVVAKRSDPEDTSYSRFVLSVELSRRPEFYFWKLFVPLLLIIGIAYCTTWMDPTLVNPRVPVCCVSLVAAVTLNFAISRALPRVPYLTFMDGFITMCYLFIGLAAVESLGLHALERHNQDALAHAIDWHFRWIYPASFAVGMLLLGVWFFVLGSSPR
jgi:hypothetical protein